MTAPVSVLDPPTLPTVVLGADSEVGQRLLGRLSGTPVDLRTMRDGAVDEGAFAGAGTLIVLGSGRGPDLDGRGGAEFDLAAVRAALGAATKAGVRQVVVLSSAMVYGAWPDNPVPLTEDAPLRPDPRLPAVTSMAELERLAACWRDDNPGASVAILRPVVMVSPDTAAWFRRSLWRSGGLQVGDADPPRQFVHVEDVVAALEVAWRGRLDGPFNVAPDGWLTAEVWRDLGGAAPRLRVPAGWVRWLRRLGFRAGLGEAPPELVPYALHPWVVANDRLRAAGWKPAFTNEEAYIAADRAGPLRSMSPRTRQELSLAGAGLVLAGTVLGSGWFLRRRQRRR